MEMYNVKKPPLSGWVYLIFKTITNDKILTQHKLILL